MECSCRSFRRFLRENGCEREFDAAFYEQCGANVLDETLADISYEVLAVSGKSVSLL